MRESGTEDGCGTGSGNGRQAAEPRRTAPPRPRPQIRTQRRKRRKSPARRGGSRATQAGGQGVKIQPPRAASLLRFFRREACVKNLTPLFSVPQKAKSRRNTPKKPRGQGSNDRKSPFSSLSDGNFTVRNADFARSDQHSHRIRHRRTGAPDFLRNFRISHKLRSISYPFPEVFIYPLRRRFQIVIFAHFRVLSFALPRFSPSPVCFSYPSFIAPLRLYFCPFRGAVFLWWQVLFSVALPADL